MVPAKTLIRKLANFVLFQVAWFACVLGGAAGLVLPATAAGILAVLVNIAFIGGDRRRDTRAAIAATAVGCCVDSACLALGAYELIGDPAFPLLCPPWLAALWGVFGVTVSISLGWLAGRPLLAAALGALGAPVSYLGGAGLGAVTLPHGPHYTAVVIAAMWAVATPLLVWIVHGPGRRGKHTPRKGPVE